MALQYFKTTRFARCLKTSLYQIRHNSRIPESSPKNFTINPLDNHDENPNSSSRLAFEDRRYSNIFGQVVKSDYLKQRGQLNDENSVVKEVKEVEEDSTYEDMSQFRNPDGSFIKGRNAEEARLHDRTLMGRVNHDVIRLPHEIAKAINNNILMTSTPHRLRSKVAQIYKELNESMLQQAPGTILESNAHIAGLFLQDYSHSFQVLSELNHRTKNFNPQRILNVGYGPGTGMIALNELMGDDFNPEVKDIYVIGRSNKEMKNRAKILLSRQMNEIVDEDITESSGSDQESFVGAVDTSKINIKSKLRDSLPVTKKYDLIIVNQALLTKEYHFPRDVDINIHMLLDLLSPEGHIVLIERGNSLGFETIARARQLMIRPESFTKEIGKIPRPYIKGSSIKPQKLRNEDQIITTDHIKYEEEMLAKLEEEEEENDEVISDLEQTINEKYGETNSDDLKLEFEHDDDFEITTVQSSQDKLESPQQYGTESVDYHLSIVAPCSHHSKCPLQLGDPKYYKIPSHKHRLDFCSFEKIVERPKYTLELKRGKQLATKWDKSANDGFGFERLKKKDLQQLQGSGRPGGNNTESGSYSYLIAQRSPNTIEDVNSIEYQRSHNSSHEVEDNPMNWPRIITNPSKIKNNVKLNTCAPSGNIEVWQIPKSLGKQVYHDARKVQRGDLWGLGKKSVITKNPISDKNKDKLDVLSKVQKKTFLKQQKKKQWKKLVSASEDAYSEDIVSLSDSIATNLENTKKYKLKGKRAQFDVDPREYDGR